jgi:hypothetical protein
MCSEAISGVEDEVVERLTRDYMRMLTRRLYHYTLSYFKYVVGHFRHFFLLEPNVDLSYKQFEWGVEIHARLYFDDSHVAMIREAVKKQLEDNRLKIKSYVDTVKKRKRGSSSEIYALLSNLRSSPSEGGREAGVPGEEAWDQERGSTAEGSEQSNL